MEVLEISFDQFYNLLLWINAYVNWYRFWDFPVCFFTCYPLLLINNDYENYGSKHIYWSVYLWYMWTLKLFHYQLVGEMFIFWAIYYRGISSIVRRCIEKETGQEFAVKIIDISGEKSDIYEADLTKRDTVREINILKMCKGHDNISKLTVHIHHKMAGCIEYTKQLICKKKYVLYSYVFIFQLNFTIHLKHQHLYFLSLNCKYLSLL